MLRLEKRHINKLTALEADINRAAKSTLWFNVDMIKECGLGGKSKVRFPNGKMYITRFTDNQRIALP